jgi:hypothetical protein
MTQSPDDKKRDEVLKRMLNTPPKPHEKKQAPKQSAKKEKSEKRKERD